MNREAFIRTLTRELSKLPQEEIAEATEYFEEFFDEATDGLDGEARLAEEDRLIREFGNPKKIAAQIKADYAARLLEGDESIPVTQPGTRKKLSAVWWVIIGICSAPIAIPLAIGAIALALEIYICSIVGMVAGVACIFAGIISLASSAAGGVMTAGIGLMMLAVSLAVFTGAVIGTRAIIRAIARRIRRSNRERKYRKLSYGSSDDGEWVTAVAETDYTEDHTDEFANAYAGELPMLYTDEDLHREGA